MLVDQTVYKKVNLIKVLICFFSVALVVLSSLVELGKVLLVVGILINLGVIWQLRRIQPALLMGIFLLSYLLYLVPYYFYDYIISAHTKYYRLDLYDKVLGIHVLFLTALFLFLKVDINRENLKLRNLIKPRSNPLIFCILYVIMLLIIFSIKGTSVLGGASDSYGTYIDNLEQQSGSVEYFYIFFTIAFYFTTSKIGRSSLLFLVALYCFMTITRGYRIQFVQMVILSFVLFFDGKFKTLFMIIMAFIGFVVSEIVNLLKLMGTVSFEEIVKLFEKADKPIIINNQTDVFYSSVVFIGLVEDNIYSFWNRGWSALGFIWNWFVPSSFVWIEARIPMYALQFTTLGGGGLVSAYFYVWFGYLGPVIIGFALAKFLNSTYSSGARKNYKIVCILVLSLYPRWFAYDPGNFLMRFSIYIGLIYMIFIFLHDYMKRSTKTV